MGQLTASIVHETKQPVTAARTYAAAALRFLDKSPPDVAEVKEALTCIVNETGRASDVVDRIGSLIKKAPPRKEVVDLNAAILEVIALTRSEAVKTGVTVGTRLAKRPLGRSELKKFTDWNDGRPGTELNFKFYRQATNKIGGISDEAAAFLGGIHPERDDLKLGRGLTSA
jgi:signal transduction histidine kinase